MNNAHTRDLLRTMVAAVTAILLAKGMSETAHKQEILWSIAYLIGAIFWAFGMWMWKEIDG